MNKKTGIVIGLVAIIAIAGIIIGTNKKSESQKPTVQQVQISEKTKTRNAALIYISQAYVKAKKGDYDGAIAACDKAIEAAPSEQVTKNCKKRVDRIFKR